MSLAQSSHNLDICEPFIVQLEISRQLIMYYASSFGNYTYVSHLMTQTKSVNCVNGYKKETPLYISCANGYVEIVDILLKYFADVSICDCDGRSPLYAASMRGHIEIVSLLLQNGGDVSVCHRDGMSPLYCCIL